MAGKSEKNLDHGSKLCMIHCAAAAGGRSLKIIFYDFRNDRVCTELVLHIRESWFF